MLELPDAFWKSILGTCWRTFAVFLVLAKRQNTVIYSGFVPLAWKKYFLQNTSVLARRWPKNIINAVILLPEAKNYFTSCDPHHDIYTCSYWHIFWHSI